MPPPAITNNIEMELAKILAREDGCHIRLYKRGIFWKAYEESALLLCSKKTLKVSRQWVKTVDREVLSVGFPDSTLTALSHILGAFIQEDDHTGHWPTAGLPKEELMALRQEYAMPIVESNLSADNAVGKFVQPARPGNEAEIINRLRTFRLAESTPMDAMQLVHALQLLLNNK